VAVKDHSVNRLVWGHALAVIAEWAVVVGVLVHAYQWGGEWAVGAASVGMVLPAFVVAPLAASLTVRRHPARLRTTAFGVQAIGYSAAATAAAVGAATPWVAGPAIVGLGAMTLLRPTGAVLLPAIVRSTESLIAANLRVAALDSSSALLGSLAAAGLAAAGGPALVLGAGAIALTVACVATSQIAGLDGRPVPYRPALDDTRLVRRAIGGLRSRPGCFGVVAASAGCNLAVGAFDIAIVVIALQVLDMGDAGPGLLSALVGAGALVAMAPTLLVVRRSLEGWGLNVAQAVAALGCVVLAVRMDAPVVVLAFPIIGLATSTVDNLARVVLQRATDPRGLGPLFALLNVVGAGGQLVGSIGTQVLVSAGGVDFALMGLAGAIGAVAALSWRSVRRADAGGAVPVVEMSLLHSIPMLAALPVATLESVARGALRIEVPAGQVVVTQGEVGDAYYAVAEGTFEVVMSGAPVGRLVRGNGFGEIALIADVARTASIIACTDGVVLRIDRDPFLDAVTGHALASQAAWSYLDHLGFGSPTTSRNTLGDPSA
jgi:hypothetical protein